MTISGASAAAPNLNVRILLVDDDETVSQLVIDMLSMDGYAVDAVPNGIAALQKLACQRYDLVLTDLHMPEMDGAGLYREIVRLQAHPRQKILFLTGTAGTSEAHRLVLETGLPLLHKPFNVSELLDLVRSLLAAS